MQGVPAGDNLRLSEGGERTVGPLEGDSIDILELGAVNKVELGSDSNVSNSSCSRNGREKMRVYVLQSSLVVNGRNVIICQVPYCDYQSDKNSNFKRHYETMHYLLDPPIECCGLRFLTKGEFKHHSKSEHTDGHRCRLCGKVFNRKALLERHTSIHTGNKPFHCSKCDYASANKANVTRHLSVHDHGEAWIKISSEGVNQSNTFAADDSFSLSSSLVDSSPERAEGFYSSQTWRRESSSFSSTRTSSPCSSVTADDKQSYSTLEDLMNTAPPAACNNPKKGRISHSIESILALPHTPATPMAHRPSEYAAATLPEGIRKSEVRGIKEENKTRINEETSTNWSHLSPHPMSLQNPSSATPALPLSSSSATVQQFHPTAYTTMMRNHYQYYAMMTYPWDYTFSYLANDRKVVGHNGNEGTPSLINFFNKQQKEEGRSMPMVSTSLNQDSGLVPGFLSESNYSSCNASRSETDESFVSQTNLIHRVEARTGMVVSRTNKEGAGAFDFSTMGSQEKVRNDWDSPQGTDSRKRVHEELFMNEATPVRPQEFVNGNGSEMIMTAHAEEIEVEDHYIPKKLRLSKKFKSEDIST